MEEEIDLRVYVEVLIRHWMWIAGLALAAAVAAFVVSSFIPPTYEATALTAVTRPRYVMQFDPRLQTAGSIQPAYQAYPELALNNDLLRDLLAQLDSRPEGIESPQDMRELLEAKQGADPSIVQLVVKSRDPEAAARIANGWAELFVAQANEVYGVHSEEDASFFEGQLAQAQEELDAADQSLIAFQSRNQGAILEARLASARQDLQDYLVEQREIERVVRNARALQAHVTGRAADTPVSPGDDLTALLLQMQAFSVRASRPAQTEGGGGVSSMVWVPESEAGSSIQLQISDAALLASGQTAGELSSSLDNLVTTLETWEEEMEAQAAALEEWILTLQQQVEAARAEETRLVCIRDVAQATHLTLARKVEEARIAAEDATGDVRLISQAAVPHKPVGPRKLLNTAVAGALGLMIGVFGAFALEWWRGSEETGGEGEKGRGRQGDKGK